MAALFSKLRWYGRICGNHLVRYLPSSLIKQVLKSISQQPRLQDRLRFHVQPYTYDSPYPIADEFDLEKLAQRRHLPGLSWNVPSYLSLIETLLPYAKEFATTPVDRQNNFDFWFHNGNFEDYDAISYYAMVRHAKPRRVIEVGCGFSSRILAHACAKNIAEGFPVEWTFIEPYPREIFLQGQPEGRFIQKRIQDVPVDFFSSLEANDILFIDTSHVIKTQSDCCYELLEIIPSLKPGVLVHIHDIFTPYDYPEDWLLDNFKAYNEQYAVECLLSHNPRYEIVLPLYLLYMEHRQQLKKLLPSGDERRCGSFWLKIK